MKRSLQVQEESSVVGSLCNLGLRFGNRVDSRDDIWLINWLTSQVSESEESVDINHNSFSINTILLGYWRCQITEAFYWPKFYSLFPDVLSTVFTTDWLQTEWRHATPFGLTLVTHSLYYSLFTFVWHYTNNH